MTNIIILGGKPCTLDLTDILYSFDYVCRININMKYKTSENKDIFYVNNHVNQLIIKQRIPPLVLKKGNYHYVDLKGLTEFHNMLNNKEYGQIIEQYESGRCTTSNNILKKLGCPLQFIKAPRCGYQAILYFLQKGYKVSVAGFSFVDEINYTEGNIENVSSCHDTFSELKILYWLHENKYIDATLCMLENYTLPLLDCIFLKPEMNNLLFFLKKQDIVILTHYYTNDILEGICNEYEKIFQERQDKISEHELSEDIYGDERIFHCEKYSEFIKKNFSNEKLFNQIASLYNPRLSKKTLINKVKYKAGYSVNSGAGWHRDNHNCQFKAIMYLSNVSEKNGCFRWVSNSNKKFIGNPKPRKNAYVNTRFDDKTIENIVENKNNNCEIFDIVGKKGTIILADTTYIHRGKIIEEGERRAITEYFF